MVRLPISIPGSPRPRVSIALGSPTCRWIHPTCVDLSYKEFKSGAASLAAAIKISDALSTSHGHAELKDLFTRLVRPNLPCLLLREVFSVFCGFHCRSPPFALLHLQSAAGSHVCRTRTETVG